MNTLEEMISILDEDKKDLFEKKLARKSANYKAKELELFKAVRNNITLKVTNQNAYHSNRKRLVNKLIELIYLEEVINDSEDKWKMDSYVTTAHYLFHHNAEKAAWNLLLKAEKIAVKNELYLEANNIYLKQIELSNSLFAPSLKQIIKKHETNKQFQELDERITIGAKLIENELKTIILTGESKQFDNIISKVAMDLKLSEGILTNPKFAFHFLSISRNIIKAQKAYHQFAPFALQTYSTLLNLNAFQSQHRFYQSSILYMICHSLYRIRDFKQLGEYLVKLENIINESPSSVKKMFHAKLVLLHASYYCFTNQLEKAIQLLSKEYSKFNIYDKVNQNLNLTIYHFMNKEPSKAIKTNHKLGHSEKWLEKHLGLEWVMKKQLMHVIIHYEMENYDIVENLIRSFELKFKNILLLDKYNKVIPFIRFIKNRLNLKEINLSELESTLITTPKEKEDLQAMIFYAWLKSKVEKRDFYGCLIEMTA